MASTVLKFFTIANAHKSVGVDFTRLKLMSGKKGREGKGRREQKGREGRRSGGREANEQTQVPKMSERLLPFPGFKELDIQALDLRIEQYT